LIKNFN